MIARIIRWSAANPFLVLLGTLFIVVAGLLAVRATAMDAIPDLSDTQVIVYADYPGQAPQVVEDQVTYPLTTALLTVPRSKVVRGYSFFGASFVYVVFEDGTDLYWARSPRARIPQLRREAIARWRDADPRSRRNRRRLGVRIRRHRCAAHAGRAAQIQDWFVRFQLSKADGVAEVASIGGFVQTYQVIVDPQKLQAYGLPLGKLTEAIRGSNRDVGGRSIEMSETEYLVRGRGYLRNADDLERDRAGQCRPARRCCCATWRRSSSAPTNVAASPN